MMKQIVTIDDLKDHLGDAGIRRAIITLDDAATNEAHVNVLVIRVPKEFVDYVEKLCEAQFPAGVHYDVLPLKWYECRPAGLIYVAEDDKDWSQWIQRCRLAIKRCIKIEKFNSSSIWCFLTSGDGDGDYPGCKLALAGFGYSCYIKLPPILKPLAEKVYPESWTDEDIKRLGRNFYWKYTEKEYGFSYSDHHLSVRYGIQCGESKKDQQWGCFLPWLDLRHVRHSLYNLQGEMYYEGWCGSPGLNTLATPEGKSRWDRQREAEETVPKIHFIFKDFDGEEGIASCFIEEREWRRGTGYFKWLSWFYKPLINRVLSLQFNIETGKRKGSWKGGTIGHSCDLSPLESPITAFQRYCGTRNMTYIGISHESPEYPPYKNAEMADDGAPKEEPRTQPAPVVDALKAALEK